MSTDSELSNPYWTIVDDFDEAYWDDDGLEPFQLASSALASRTMARYDLAIFFLERMDLERFRLKSGRLNYRKMAIELNALIAQRNKSAKSDRRSHVQEVGLRSMEMTIKRLLSKK